MSETRIDQITFWGVGGLWLILSILLLLFCISRGRQKGTKVKRSALYALGISNLLTPTLLVAYVYPVIVPATYGALGFALSIAFGDLWIFDQKNAAFLASYCVACWWGGYIVTFLVCIVFTKTKNQNQSAQVNPCNPPENPRIT